jgi:broad specificity phosphatase PhoE
MTDYQQFVVIRHGESETNATNTFQAGNQYDSDPLTPLGAEDAGRLAQRLALLPVDLVVSSSYLRARSTATLIAEATGAPHVIPVRQGSTWVDLPADDPDVRNPCVATARDRRPQRAAGAAVPGPSRTGDSACRHGGRRPTERPLFG